MFRPITRLAAVAAIAATAASGTATMAFALDFHARPTTPLDCRATSDAPWIGFFHGRKEMEYGPWHYVTANLDQCFRTAADCRNWLYNMQSEYDDMVWSATCNPRH